MQHARVVDEERRSRIEADGDRRAPCGRGEHLAERAFEAEARIFAEFLLNQVGDDLCVGFGLEAVIEFLQLAFEFEIVFDDAVVNYADAA